MEQFSLSKLWLSHAFLVEEDAKQTAMGKKIQVIFGQFDTPLGTFSQHKVKLCCGQGLGGVMTEGGGRGV